jgi:glycosyltransferase involved in cell wall biosynthesis
MTGDRGRVNILAVAGRLRIRSGYLHMLDLLRALAAGGHGVTLVCRSRPADLLPGDLPFPVHEWPEVAGRWPVGSVSAARAFCRARGIGLVHVHGGRHGPWVEHFLGTVGLPVALTPHMEGGFMERWENRRLQSLSRRVIALSEFRRESLVNHCRVPRDRVRVVLPGLDLAARAERLPDLAHTTPVVGVVAPLDKGRGQDVFLHAARALLHTGRDIQFLVAGDGPEEGALRRLAAELGIEKRVTFATRLLNYSDAISTVDIFVRPAMTGRFAYSVIEAMAFGKPVIATPTGDVPELVTDGVTGLIIPKGDPTVLVAAVADLLAEPERARRMGAAGRARVAERFHAGRMLAETLAVYEEAMAG